MTTARRSLLALLAVSAVAGKTHAQDSVQIRRLAPGVFAATQPAGMRFDDANSAIIVLDDGVLIVDSQNSPAGARAVIARIHDLTDKPVRWVLNTHWHGDHVQGNQEYQRAFPGVEFIAHSTVAEDIRQRAATQLAEELRDTPAWIERARAALAQGSADGQTLTTAQKEQLRGRLQRREAHLARIREVTEFITPTRSFDDTLTIGRGRAVELIHFPGHTRGDVVAWLPAERILISGDLLDDLPFTGHGSPRALLQTLQRFATLGFQYVIPGHGAVREGHDHLRNVTALFEAIVRQAEAARREGLSLDTTQARVDLSAFRNIFVTDEVAARYWPFFTTEAIRRAWEDAAAGLPAAAPRSR